MPPIAVFAGLFVVGAALGWLFEGDEKEPPKPPSEPPRPPTEAEVKREELRRVMSYLGKRSGKARGGRL